jgi:hypothetical protein
MRFRNVTVLVSLFVVCFVLAAQSAKADDITFTDLTDTPTLGGSSRLSGITCSLTALVETCTAILTAPTGFSAAAGLISFRLGEGSTTGNVSDAFVGVIVPATGLSPSFATLTFTSDLPNAAGEANGLGQCVFLFLTACNAVENGTPQLVGTITWRNGTNTVTDNLRLTSDTSPEPASLILFGSGLVIAGGFLRRRRQRVTPSPVV